MRIVRSGMWLYDGSVEKPVDVVAFDFDWWHEFARADGSLEAGDEARPLGPDGFLYYVRFRRAGDLGTPTWVDSYGHDTAEAAMDAAAQKAPTQIVWLRT